MPWFPRQPGGGGGDMALHTSEYDITDTDTSLLPQLRNPADMYIIFPTIYSSAARTHTQSLASSNAHLCPVPPTGASGVFSAYN